MPTPRPVKCKFCGKDIVWVVNKATGRVGPIDARTTTVYRITGESRGKDHLADAIGGVHLSHWVTCPKRAEAAAARDAKR